MKTLLAETKTAALLTAVLALLVCGLYPLLVWAPAQLLFPADANGRLLRDADSTVRGAELIGQSFTGPGYFHSRPSAAGAGYDAVNSGGSNLGPTSRQLADLVRRRVAAYRAENRLPDTIAVPADAVTASGSGLDPHISLANARLQTARVATARGLAIARVTALVDAARTGLQFGFLGEDGVNVLLLNRALDHAAPRP